MSKKILIALLVMNLTLISCSKKTMASDYTNPVETKVVTTESILPTQKSTNNIIPYTIARNYFVKNTFKSDHFNTAKIASQADFDQLFGAAAYMGADGKPTTIDFTKQYVIAVTEKETNIETTLIPDSLTKVGQTIVFKYEIKRGGKTTFTMRPFLILIVDKKHQGKIQVKSLEVK